MTSNLLNDLRIEGSTTSHTHIGRESRVWDPLCGVTRVGFFQHTIDLFEGESLGLGDEEVGVDEASGTERSPNEEDARTEIGVTFALSNHVWGDDSDDTVPEPVGSSRKSDTTGSNGEGKDFADEDPGTRAPGGGEEEDVDANESNLSGHGGMIVLRFSASCNTNNTNNELTDQHTKSAPNEDCTTSISLNDPKGEGSRADIDESGNKIDQEWIADRS